MASRAVQQDSFIDEEESCPLCVEEFDLSDRGFRPCPCGFQICQFCFNKIRTDGSGSCPACRRQYDDKSIEWKVVSSEEFKADLQKQTRKKEELKRKEAQKREYESLDRKRLAGLRVVQKNLVYVVGLNPRIRDEDLHQTLRGDQYFGQYGKIIKIVVGKPKEGVSRSDQSLGVYVTFERKEDAENCIKAVDGSRNGDRTLKAQFGTTKYCSAYLRNEQCPNKSCMFLHEPGEDKDSFTREDLSSKNAESNQAPGPAPASMSGPARVTQSHPLPARPAQIASSAMSREAGGSNMGSEDDSSALPPSVSWADKGAQAQTSQTSSQAAKSTTTSPAVHNAQLNTTRSAHVDDAQSSNSARPNTLNDASSTSDTAINATGLARPTTRFLLEDAVKAIMNPDFKTSFNKSLFTEDEYQQIISFPPLFADNGGERRQALKQKERALQQTSEVDELVNPDVLQDTQDEEPGSGSLQLGGEPDPPLGDRGIYDRLRQNPLASNLLQSGPYPKQNAALSGLSNLSLNTRNLTSAQQQQLLQMKTPGGQNNNNTFMNQFSSGIGGSMPYNPSPTSQPNWLQSQGQTQAHGRNLSRYSFANDSASASTSVKPSANAKAMAQQAAMMPTNPPHSSGPSHHTSHAGPLNNQSFGGVQGPPPGLKATGTPPFSGGGMFGQGHGFTSNMGRGHPFSTEKENQSEMLRDLLRGRGGAGSASSGHFSEAGKSELMFPFVQAYPTSSSPAPASSLGSVYGSYPVSYHESGPSKHKKKGKKHRHANTSSSGGGGIVDLADPTLLQTRMQQQGASGGSGQGLYGGQGQGGYNPSMYGGFGQRW